MILRCFALSYYLYCLRLRCLVSFSFYSTIFCAILLYLMIFKGNGAKYRRHIPRITEYAVCILCRLELL
ncbi:Uncharacterised protein [Neisseria animalis]|nr:Uncharacterised protein [Neisseria animalis]